MLNNGRAQLLWYGRRCNKTDARAQGIKEEYFETLNCGHEAIRRQLDHESALFAILQPVDSTSTLLGWVDQAPHFR
eukprot:19791-Heterococcus_DN1.PRE.2